MEVNATLGSRNGVQCMRTFVTLLDIGTYSNGLDFGRWRHDIIHVPAGVKEMGDPLPASY